MPKERGGQCTFPFYFYDGAPSPPPLFLLIISLRFVIGRADFSTGLLQRSTSFILVVVAAGGVGLCCFLGCFSCRCTIYMDTGHWTVHISPISRAPADIDRSIFIGARRQLLTWLFSFCRSATTMGCFQIIIYLGNNMSRGRLRHRSRLLRNRGILRFFH